MEKLALTNNMAAVGIRTLLAVSVDGTLSNDPSPSQTFIIYTSPPPLCIYYSGKCRKTKITTTIIIVIIITIQQL